jgi:hypothetical protein
MNPSLNSIRDISAINGIGPNKTLSGFDGFADLNPFTMKTLDAYRMHLWGKMAAQQQMHQQQNQTSQNHQNPSGLASNLRPHFFSASPKPNLLPPAGYGSTLSALLSGKQHNVPYSTSSSSAYLTPPPSPSLLPKGGISPSSYSSSSSLSSSQKEQQNAMLAAMASQTVFRKLGSAVWDAFIGSPSHSSSRGGDWDADKVRKVLEGKAVLRVVDVQPPAATGQTRSPVASTSLASSSSSNHQTHATEESSSSSKMCCSQKTKAAVCDILEESMRGLSLGKKM